MTQMPFRELQKNQSQTVRVTPTVYEGYELVDVRIYALNRSTGEIGPTRRGISLNVDAIPELIDALTWALGQPCSENGAAPERVLESAAADRLAQLAWRALRDHGSAVHWDMAERIVLGVGTKEFSKWDLHFVLATRTDLFESVGQGRFRARTQG
jgi:Transcriptional Coactivator p15 (PC4)